MNPGCSGSLPELVETAGDSNVKYQGRLLYSERGPLFAARRAAAAAERGPARLYLVPSPGLWYGIPELLSTMERGSALLCVEAENSLMPLELEHMPQELRALVRPDGSPLPGSPFAFIRAENEGDIENAARALARSLSLSFRRCVLISLCGGAGFHAGLYRGAASRINALCEAHWRSKAALLSMGRLWARNIFRNLASLPDIAPEPPPHLGPCIVCGAGPSLESSLPFIASEQKAGKLAVVACDTALSPLIDYGIEPDLLVCLEGQAYNLADFTIAGKRPVRLMADLSSHPCTFTAPAGPKFLSFVRIIDSGFLDRISALLSAFYPGSMECPPLGSVGVHALHIARRLSDGPLFIAGLDFCYETGKTHARGSPSLRTALASQNRLSRWPGQYSSSMRALESPLGPFSRSRGIITDPGLASYAALLADELAGPGPAVWDLRGGGLPLGIKSIDFDSARALLRGAAAAKSENAAARGTAALLAQTGPGLSERHAAAAAFIDGEISKLTSMEAPLKGRAPFDRGEFCASILSSDYLIWSFPDSDRLFELPQDMLNRILVEIEYWIWKLSDIRTICGR